MKNDRNRDVARSDLTQVVDSIRAIVKALRDSGRDTEQKLGITSAQLFVLQELRNGPASINELAARTYTHQSSVSMVVARLVEQRLVTRNPSKTDARRLAISLTGAGRSLIRKSLDAAQTRIVSALKALSRSDLNDLASHLTRLTEIMEEQDQSPKYPQKQPYTMTA